MPPWRYLGLEIGKRTIVPQKLEIKAKIQTLADVHQLCGALNWVRPWLGLTTEDLAPLFNLLKGGEELSSPRELTPEAKEALERVQHLMSTRQAHRCDPDLPFKFIIMGKLPHLHGVIFQWRNNIKKDQGREDPLLIIEWVFLSHQRSKRMTRPQELVAELIRKARVRIRELAGCDFECIHIPIGLRSGQITKAMLEHLLQENEALQFALDSFTGQISIHRPAHKIFNQDAKFTLNLKDVRSRKPLEALTVFTDVSGKSHKSVMTWKDPQTQQWEADVAEVEGSPQKSLYRIAIGPISSSAVSFLLRLVLVHHVKGSTALLQALTSSSLEKDSTESRQQENRCSVGIVSISFSLPKVNEPQVHFVFNLTD
ncbi:hypothetical protein DUI87_04583 [Hirundo rustica rustica]|uniref:Reverse transcriptase thumb domain-containing protein n=1 Tax=Hirundo rustica rustica TaxID=333673 RepID=A0A3M0LI25_HIRRU|nr:hypothetical protein DUI87_04583 [Hirundo rustica rustica]